MTRHAPRCLAFWLWGVAGALALLSVVSFIGVFTALPALALLLLASRARPRWPEALGLLAGFGVLCLVIAGLTAAGGHGLDAAPWAAAGAVLLSGGVAGYAAARGRSDAARAASR